MHCVIHVEAGVADEVHLFPSLSRARWFFHKQIRPVVDLHYPEPDERVADDDLEDFYRELVPILEGSWELLEPTLHE